ncbi:MAG: 17-beta-hydroxysteroid dehydrogenase [Labilithrix sp.]|nr:17-beta-hydroxysteroid dehydrogenase [Labilithrix sp.]
MVAPSQAAGMNVLVTGTSTGFGHLTALALGARGHRVFATMRSPDGKNRERAAALREKAGIDVLELDVTSEASVDAAITSALRTAGHLDAVINNAGQATIGLSETITPAQLLALYDINVVGMQRVNRAVLPSMRERKSGLLVHVSSALGRWVMPVVGLYASTKFAVEALAETYRYDLKATGVDVAIVQPGAYPTELGSGEAFGADQDRAKGYGPLAGALTTFGERAKATKGNPDAPNPQEVADAIVALVEAAPGQRPARVVVDASKSPFTPQLNEAHAQVQRQLLQALGMGVLAD